MVTHSYILWRIPLNPLPNQWKWAWVQGYNQWYWFCFASNYLYCGNHTPGSATGRGNSLQNDASDLECLSSRCHSPLAQWECSCCGSWSYNLNTTFLLLLLPPHSVIFLSGYILTFYFPKCPKCTRRRIASRVFQRKEEKSKEYGTFKESDHVSLLATQSSRSSILGNSNISLDNNWMNVFFVFFFV